MYTNHSHMSSLSNVGNSILHFISNFGGSFRDSSSSSSVCELLCFPLGLSLSSFRRELDPYSINHFRINSMFLTCSMWISSSLFSRCMCSSSSLPSSASVRFSIVVVWQVELTIHKGNISRSYFDTNCNN